MSRGTWPGADKAQARGGEGAKRRRVEGAFEPEGPRDSIGTELGQNRFGDGDMGRRPHFLVTRVAFNELEALVPFCKCLGVPGRSQEEGTPAGDKLCPDQLLSSLAVIGC